jgi:hypothetical protein
MDEMEHVWVTAEHQCAIWCNQLASQIGGAIVRLSRELVATMNATNQISEVPARTAEAAQSSVMLAHRRFHQLWGPEKDAVTTSSVPPDSFWKDSKVSTLAGITNTVSLADAPLVEERCTHIAANERRCAFCKHDQYHTAANVKQNQHRCFAALLSIDGRQNRSREAVHNTVWMCASNDHADPSGHGSCCKRNDVLQQMCCWRWWSLGSQTN